jgi:glycosyltransferase involved in cell wall biosynthesis
VGKLGDRVAVYECVDDFTAARGLVDARVIGQLERRVIERVDLFVATHAGLLEKKQAGAKRAILVPNGVDADHFQQAADPTTPVANSLARLKHPVIGYLGGINYWIDTALLAYIARQYPDWTLALVGPAYALADLKPLAGLPNVVMTGRVPYEEVPCYVKAFDVCVNPYVLDQVAEHCSPLKLYEYLATGKPVVSVDMPEAHQFRDLVAIARNPDDFVALVEQAVRQPDGRAAERICEAHRHTWDQRFETITSTLAGLLSG